MKKLFTLLTLALLSIGSAWATDETAVISWKMGTNGGNASSANSITGASGCAAEDFTIAITGNTSKNWSSGGGSISYNSTSYATLKNSNGAQNTITCPSGKVATQVVFYVTTNATDGYGKLSEIDGTSCNDEVSTQKNYSSPTVITKSIDNKASFTFTFSTKQVCFIAVVTYTDAPEDVVANPTFALNGSSLTMSCVTAGTTVHYTLDGSEPTASSPSYSSAITLENSCTVRAKAFKGTNNEYSSEIVKRDCYVSHPSAVSVLGYNGGTVSGDVWTSTNGEYILTNNVADRGIGYVNLAGSQDGFKLNHTDSYTLKVSNNVKVTKIVVVGKSWLQGSAGNASTFAIDGFTPASGTFYDYPTDGETYVKTIEFTPTSELGYGASITLRPGTNQLGAYIEVYGTEYAPSVTAYEDPRTWNFTNWSDATKTGVKGDATNWYDKEKADGTPLDFTVEHQDGRSNKTAVDGDLKFGTTNIAETDGLKYTGAAYTMALMFDLPSTTLGDYNGSQYLWLYGNSSVITIPSVTKGSVIEIGVETHKTSDARGVTVSNSTQTQGSATSTTYQECKWTVNTAGDITITPTKGLHIYYIKLSKAKDAVTIAPAKEYTTYVTTKALDFTGLDLKAYVATAASASSVTLDEVTTVPAGTPLVLKKGSADSYDVPVAASASVPATNLLEAGDGKTSIGGDGKYDYVLNDGKFYHASAGTVAVGKAYLHLDAAPSAPVLDIDFGGTTGIGEIKSQKIENGQFYDLQGRKVAQPTKGLYIVNGRKVVIK